MNIGLVITIISLMFMFLISGVYFSKKRITILENKIYEALLISTIIGLVINILSFMLDIFFGDLLFLRLVFIKIYYSYILLCEVVYERFST